MYLGFIAIIIQKAKLRIGTRGRVLWSSWPRLFAHPLSLKWVVMGR